MPSVSVSVGHSGRLSRPHRRLLSVRLDSDYIDSLSLLIFYFLTFIPTVTSNVTGKEKERGPTGTRTQGLSLTVRAL